MPSLVIYHRFPDVIESSTHININIHTNIYPVSLMCLEPLHLYVTNVSYSFDLEIKSRSWDEKYFKRPSRGKHHVVSIVITVRFVSQD